MTPDEALAVLGLSSPTTVAAARVAFRERVRVAHPDVAGPASTGQASQITQAYALLRAVAARGDGATIDTRNGTGDAPVPRPGSPASAPGPRAPTPPRPSAYEEAVEAELAAGDTLLVHAPPPEAYAVIFEAAGRIGHIAYFDRSLGIIESIVRFEGGPSCSLLITLQGRSHGTEAFCTMDSIEAAPAPPIRPVVEALVDAIRSL